MSHVEGVYYDVNKNVKREIIMTNEDEASGMKIDSIRIGKNLNKDRLVKGG